MSTRLKSKILSMAVVMIVAAGVLWACGGAGNQVAAPAAPEQAIAPTNPVAVNSTATPAAAATISTTTLASTTTQTTNSDANVRVFTIDSGKSEARFTLNEVLMGSPKTVVGVTSLITGTIAIDLADPAKTTISPLQIDARDFQTDSSMRNRAINRFVLQTTKDEYRYIIFTPTSIEGLPATAKAGDAFELKIKGDLTISGVTKPATFTTSVNTTSDTELTGLAKTQVLRSDFNLNIPNVPSVADVTEEVQLELQFVAKAE
ncbi:hypothetical protein BH10CHL1_BH10CHL1_43720 [soil metagenome]